MYDTWNGDNNKITIFNDYEYSKIKYLYIISTTEVILTLNGSIFQKKFENITLLLCRGFSLNNFTNVNNNIEQIEFDNLNIHRLESYYFEKLNKLEVLTITDNNINVLQNYIFKDLKKVTTLDLSNNHIARIESNTFVGLCALRVLDLNFNSILELDIHTFRITNNLGKSLTKTIRDIKLTSSELQIIESKSFIFDNMTSIDLSYNQITSIEKNAFDIKTILLLNLKGNKLSSIDRNVFFSIHIIDIIILSNNEIVCDCKLYWIKKHNNMLKNINNSVNKDIHCEEINLLEHIENMNCTSTRGTLYIYIYIYIYI